MMSAATSPIFHFLKHNSMQMFNDFLHISAADSIHPNPNVGTRVEWAGEGEEPNYVDLISKADICKRA